MSYLNSLNKYRTLADKIIAGEYEPQSKTVAQESKRSLISRPEKTSARQEQVEPEQTQPQSPEDALMEYMLMMRKKGQAAEDGIDTQTVKSATRPKARGDFNFDTPVTGVLLTSFQDQLGLEESTADVLTKAFLLNFQDESGMIADRVEMVPNVHGTRGKGFYQLTGPRRDTFEAVYGEDGYTAENQVEFLIKELVGSEKAAGKAILSAAKSGNIGETAAVIVDKFLRPAEEYKQERMSRYRNKFPS